MRDNKPSETAHGVAALALALSADRTQPGLVAPEYAEQLARLMQATGLMKARSTRILRSRVMAWLYRTLLERVMPGQFAAVGQRKAFFESRARAAILRGASRVLVLGAGYDLLCLRLAPEFPEVRFLEIDHPATASAKQRGLRALDAPENVTSVPADLAERSLSEVLDEAGWDRSAVSMVCAEGLTQYLSEQTVRELLAEVALVTAPRSAFALTFVGWREDQNRPEAGPKTDRTLARFAKRGEPWLWGCDPSRLEEFLADGPWVVAVPPSAAGLDHLVELERVS